MPRQSKGKAAAAAAAAGGPNKSKKTAKPPVDEKKEVLRAVLITESFQDRFRPFSLEKPRCLLPLANIPMIEYSLNLLALNGVQEVFIYTGQLSDQVEQYIAASPRWASGSPANPFSTLDFIPLQDARSVGDVLRDLDKRALVDGDFVVLHGDVVSNIDLAPALAAHRRRREADEAANVMTMVLREAGGEADVDGVGMAPAPHRTRPNGGITPVFVLDSETGRCLHYDEMHALAANRTMLLDPTIPLEMSRDFEVRADLIDPGIDIYTPHALALWGEKFDAQLPRAHFLRGVLQEWELNEKHVFAEVAPPGGYAARASNLPMYDAIARDVLDRWTFPFVPESNLLPGSTYCSLGGSAGEAVVERKVVFGKGSELSRCVVGRGTTIGRGARIVRSTIGRDCHIGDGVVIEDSFVWDNVAVGPGTTIRRSIVAHGVVIGENCSVAAGSLISFDVRISDSIALPAPVVLSTVKQTDTTPIADHDTALLGPEARGAPFLHPVPADLDPEDASLLERGLVFTDLGHDLDDDQESVSSVGSEEFSDEDDDDDDHHHHHEENDDALSNVGAEAREHATSSGEPDRTRTMSYLSDSSAYAQDVSFRREGMAWLLDALRDEGASEPFESTRLEFLALRLARNASEHAIRRAVADAFVGRTVELMGPDTNEGGGGSLDASRAASRVLGAREGVTGFVRDVGVAADRAGIAGQVAFVLTLQEAVTRAAADMEPGKAGGLLAAMLQRLYNADVVEEEGITAWWEDERAVASEDLKALREKCRGLVEWLETAEEEDDSDGDGDGDEDEDEDEG